MAILLGAAGLPGGITERVRASGGSVLEVYPTGDAVQDLQNVQSAIDSADEGDTVLLKAGTFNFGDWKTNPIPGGFVVIDKGITLKGDGFDASGDPRTIIQGGGYRNKGHWEHGEYAVVVFSGDASGGVLEDVWLKEPHFYAVGCTGFSGQNHENITVRNVKITDISHDIPGFYPWMSYGSSIDMGANIPQWGLGGPSGIVTVENCTISNTGSQVDLGYVDPDTGTPYYRNPAGGDLVHESWGMSFWMCTGNSLMIRGNKLAVQNEGIQIAATGGEGFIEVSDNDVTIETTTLSATNRHGFRCNAWDPNDGPIPFAMTLRLQRNKIRVIGEPEEGVFTAGVLIGTDDGAGDYAGSATIEHNEIEMQGGDAALILGAHYGVPFSLNGAVVKANRIRGSARYGILSVHGAQNCVLSGNNMATLTPGVAHVGLYGSAVHDNVLRGYSGVVDEAGGAYNNLVTGYTPMSSHATPPYVPPVLYDLGARGGH
jgi:hypothetical protein